MHWGGFNLNPRSEWLLRSSAPVQAAAPSPSPRTHQVTFWENGGLAFSQGPAQQPRGCAGTEGPCSEPAWGSQAVPGVGGCSVSPSWWSWGTVGG